MGARELDEDASSDDDAPISDDEDSASDDEAPSSDEDSASDDEDASSDEDSVISDEEGASLDDTPAALDEDSRDDEGRALDPVVDEEATSPLDDDEDVAPVVSLPPAQDWMASSGHSARRATRRCMGSSGTSGEGCSVSLTMCTVHPCCRAHFAVDSAGVRGAGCAAC